MPGKEDANKSHNRKSIGEIAAIAGVLVAITGVLVAVLAWRVPMTDSEAQPKPGSTTSSAPPDKPKLPTKNQSSPPLQGNTTTPEARTIRHAGRLVMVEDGPRANLDALPDDPQWRGSPDLLFRMDALSPGWPGAYILNVPGREEPDCSQQTGYSEVRTKPAEMLASGNPWLCVKTGEGRFSAVEVASVGKVNPNTTTDKVELIVKTYE